MTETDSRLLMEAMWRLSKAVESQAESLLILQSEINHLRAGFTGLYKRMQLHEAGLALYEIHDDGRKLN